MSNTKDQQRSKIGVAGIERIFASIWLGGGRPSSQAQTLSQRTTSCPVSGSPRLEELSGQPRHLGQVPVLGNLELLQQLSRRCRPGPFAFERGQKRALPQKEPFAVGDVGLRQGKVPFGRALSIAPSKSPSSCKIFSSAKGRIWVRTTPMTFRLDSEGPQESETSCLYEQFAVAFHPAGTRILPPIDLSLRVSILLQEFSIGEEAKQYARAIGRDGEPDWFCPDGQPLILA